MIGYYVHHHGRGHATRMRSIVEHLATPCTVLSSLEPRPDERADWLILPRDDLGSAPRDVTARGRLHWVPRHDHGLADRSARMASWLAEHRPALMVVDVSVEVALLSRVCGTPVVVMGMPGRRDDRAHTFAYDVADAVIAPWPAGLETAWPEHWTTKTTFVGSISRFDGCRPQREQGSRTGRQGLLLWGAGGDGTGERVLESLLAGTPGWHWEVAGLGESHLTAPEVWRALARADVVVTHGGLNSVAEVAAARRPAVVIADDRPFDEQRTTVRWLEKDRLAATSFGCPDSAAWSQLLDEAVAMDPRRWHRWSTGGGAKTAAALLDTLSHDLSAGPS